MRTFAQRQQKIAGNSVARATQPIVRDVLRAPGRPLEPSTQHVMESRLGYNFANVRVHADEHAGDAAAAVDARAFTVGRDIVFAAGEYAPQTRSGSHLLSHELAHVAQRTGGDPTSSGRGVSLVVSDTHDRAEVEAHRAADDMASGRRAQVQRIQGEAVLLREPAAAESSMLPEGRKKRLRRLWAAVKATDIGRTFLKNAKDEPTLAWGQTNDGFNGEITDGVITLNEAKELEFSDCQWEQVIAMELGNFANKAAFDWIHDEAKEGSLSEDQFVTAIEQLELDSRNLVIRAFNSGAFGAPGPDCVTIFLGGLLEIDQYMEAGPIAKHIAAISDKWKKTCSKQYYALHPDEAPAKPNKTKAAKTKKVKTDKDATQKKPKKKKKNDADAGVPSIF